MQASIRDWLNHMMAVRGWSQEEVAEKVDVHQTQISRWKRGATVPDRAHRIALAQAFGVPEADLHIIAGDPLAARPTGPHPQRERAHVLIDVMAPEIITDILPMLERLVIMGDQS